MRRTTAHCVVAVVCLALLTPACHLIYPFNAEEAAGDAAADSSALPDIRRRDLIVDGERREGRPPDQAPLSPCAASPDSDTLALYTFESENKLMFDAVGQHHGSVVGKPQLLSGKGGCGKALTFPAVPGPGASDYGVIPHHTIWNTVKSVDLWVRFDATRPQRYAALLSRDANQVDKPGHLGIYRLCNDAVYVRLQHAKGELNICSPPISVGTWHHVGLNLGPPGVALVVDGVPAKPGAEVTCGTDTFNCKSFGAADITGNANPWAVGASSSKSSEGKLDVVQHQLHGAVDSLRISSARRAFAAP